MIIHGHATGSILSLREPLRDSPVQLRWGGPPVGPQAINGSAALLGGLAQLENLAVRGVPTVDFTTSIEEAHAWLRQGATVYARDNEHTQGKDILCAYQDQRSVRPVVWKYLQCGRSTPQNIADFRAKDFWTKWVPSLREWRFHILRSNGEYTSIGRALKVWEGDRRGEPPGNNPTSPCVRSRRLGWVMAHNVDPPEGLRTLAKRAVAACSYDLGAVDILETPQGGVVLEVNSRPAIRDPYTIERYTDALRDWRR
jgi:hypothetical protein